MCAMPVFIIRRGLAIPRVEPVVIITFRFAAITIMQLGMIHIRATVRLSDHDPLAPHTKLTPDLVGADHGHVPLHTWRRGLASRCSQGASWGSGAQARAGNDSVHFGAGGQIETYQSPAAYFQRVDHIIGSIFHAKTVKRL